MVEIIFVTTSLFMTLVIVQIFDLLSYFDFILYFDKAEREEARERGQMRCQMLRARLARQKEKLHCLREKYTILLDM